MIDLRSRLERPEGWAGAVQLTCFRPVLQASIWIAEHPAAVHVVGVRVGCH